MIYVGHQDIFFIPSFYFVCILAVPMRECWDVPECSRFSIAKLRWPFIHLYKVMLSTVKYNINIFKQHAVIKYVHSKVTIMDVPTNRSNDNMSSTTYVRTRLCNRLIIIISSASKHSDAFCSRLVISIHQQQTVQMRSITGW